jgi:hypothetical protein
VVRMTRISARHPFSSPCASGKPASMVTPPRSIDLKTQSLPVRHHTRQTVATGSVCQLATPIRVAKRQDRGGAMFGNTGNNRGMALLFSRTFRYTTHPGPIANL